MATIDVSTKPAEPAIRSLLARARRWIRAYIWIEGLTLTVAIVMLAFWASLAFDWLFEPPRQFRVGLQVAAVLGALAVLYWTVLRRAFVPLRDKSLALVIERQFPNFRDSLLTAVELDRAPPDDPIQTAMLAAAHRKASGQAVDLPLRRAFNMAGLFRKIAAMLVLVASVVVFAVAAREAFGVWIDRLIHLSDEPWPRRTHLAVAGFEGVVKVARGADREIRVVASGDVPDTVEVRYATEETSGRETMTRAGAATSQGEQAFTFSFRSIAAPISFDVLGGDNRVRNLRIEVVESPTLAQMRLRCVYPKYLKRADAIVPVSGLTRVPRGTQVTVEATANKDLRGVDVSIVSGGETTKISQTLAAAKEPRRVVAPLPALEEDTSLQFLLHDIDDIRSREPIRLTLSVVPDEAPSLKLRLRSIGSAITAQARLPLDGELSDDYGIAKAWFDYAVVGETTKQQPLQTAVAGRSQIELTRQSGEALEVEPLELKVGQKLEVRAKASDFFELTGEPNVGQSDRYELEVVTAEGLISMLEARELTLRRRFETILGEFTDTRDLLDRLDGGVKTATPLPTAAREPGDASAKPAGSEPGESGAGAIGSGDVSRTAGEATSAAELASQRSVRLLRVLQNAQRSGQETGEVAYSFEAILEELANNRIDTPALQIRLGDQIAVPLRKIADNEFPELIKRLSRLQTLPSADPGAAQAREAAMAQADVILRQMRLVLANMVELETFNELVERLRGIIEAQDRVSKQTLQKRRQQALEDE